MGNGKNRDYRLLSDEPVRETKREDGLNFEPAAEVLAGAALQTDSPITIGVFGSWGSGKTSLMRLMHDIVAKEGQGENAAVPVWFNAWQYEREEHLIIPLIATIARDIKKREKEWEEQEKEQNKILLTDDLNDVARKALDTAQESLAIMKAGGKQVHDVLRSVLYGISMKGEFGVPGLSKMEVSASVRDMIERYEAITQDTLMARSLYFEAFDQLRALARDDQVKKPQIVVFIDDLDRCFPERAVHLLESVKLILHQPKFAFVLGIYPEIIEQFVRNKYAGEYPMGAVLATSGGGDAELRQQMNAYLKYFDQYLEKIVQVRHNVPERKSEQMHGYIEELLKNAGVAGTFLEGGKGDKDLLDLIAEVGERNPRGIVRKINGLITKRRIKKREGDECSVWALVVNEVAGEPKYAEFRVDLGVVVKLKEREEEVGAFLAEALGDGQEIETHEDRIEALRKALEALGSLPPAMKRAAEKLDKDVHLFNVLRTAAGREWLSSADYRENLHERLKEPEESPEPQAAKPKRSKRAGDVLGDLLASLVSIQGGQFVMGDGLNNDNPKHTVRLDGFEILATPVTQAQYEAVMGTNPSHFKGEEYPNASDHPVEQVSWEEAKAFCERLTELRKESGLQFTLPTEAQWEYACRAGSTTRYCFGDSEGELEDYAWYNENSEGRTHPVGQKRPNDWGLYDMHGNVWEWCLDWYDSAYYAKPEAAENPTGPPEGPGRVVRGGGWNVDPGDCRSACRDDDSPGFRSYDLGFRVLAVPAAGQ